ncbi:Rhodanese-like protein [Massarina eburnea CBS 473.64]|uniref:M-phase inducer phosphatase n=1 Tax=Massarina eburnea CBS 473.64 TaxID=1395130 RepID=A0A6A6RWG3_9PLEO|nr:Rhodanese-like protein [Massarina eburnea CBS 473.64]
MEMSSPLAAMHPPPLPCGPWGYRRDFPSKSPFGAPPKNFNFRDLSMKRTSSDYFSLQPVAGSSPTASLAADMSSNLHVDQSPQLATPRRSLFTSNLSDNRAGGTKTPPVRWAGVTTPPIPSSSPNFVPDSMDISPLPHKAPFNFASERYLPSPSPLDTNAANATPAIEDEMLSPCAVPAPPKFSRPELENPRPISAAEHRKPALLRPSLSKSKTFSTNAVSFKSREQNPLPTFKFGAGVDTLAPSPSPASLDECFAPSPPQERRTFANPLMGPSRPRLFERSTSTSRASVPPGPGCAVRKPAGPPARRPTKFRRSLSMFESPGDVMNPKQDNDNYTPSGLQSVMDVDEVSTPKLPYFIPPSEPDSLPRISDTTLIGILNGEYDHLYEEKIIVDCRFEYEYTGGHITGAVNFCDKDLLGDRLFTSDASSTTTNTLVVLHCEYSAHRAPLMAKYVRNEDRKINCHRYPQLTFPEVYILDGGYSSFFGSHRERCFPQQYLRMDAEEHQEKCERGMDKLRQRSKFSRAQTYAVGQRCSLEESPTAVSRSRSGANLNFASDALNIGRIGTTRRMASY